MTRFNDTVTAPAFETTAANGILSGGNGGVVRLFHPADHNRPHVELVGNETAANTGGGLVTVTDGGGNTTIQLTGNSATIAAQLLELHGANGGVVRLFHPADHNRPHVELVGNETAPANTGGGLVTVTDSGGNTTIQLTGNSATIAAQLLELRGANGGTVRLFHPGDPNRPHVELVGNETAPANTGGGLITVRDGGGNTTVQLIGQTGMITATNLTISGDIVLTEADCSEDFDIATGETAEPGSVMVIDEEGALKESNSAYDRKVAGVISGAGDYKPGITLDRQSAEHTGRMPIALSGKVFCKVDAGYDQIEVGDLLVTSPTPAHAMKATDPTRAFGAVIGKTLRGLERGRGLLPILVSLQ